MTDSMPLTREWIALESGDEGPEVTGRESGERTAPDLPRLLPRAQQFRITDLQHWIDLCA